MERPIVAELSLSEQLDKQEEATFQLVAGGQE